MLPPGFAQEALAAPTPFAAALPIPPVLRPAGRKDGRDLYELTMRSSNASILKGKKTPIWGYDGRFPGPTIKVTKGEPVIVRQINRLKVNTTIHLHGGHVPAKHDGHPADVIEPGDHRDYRYPNEQDAATLWYHDHSHHTTSRNIYKGLAGVYIIEDPDERELNLPGGKFDIPLIIQDRSFKKNGSFKFQNKYEGVFGDVYLVNGKPIPHLKVANRKYRFRILNASNSRIYTLKLDSPQPMTQIASDGGLLAAPVMASTITLAAAERVEIVIDFSMFPVGTSVVLQDNVGPTPLDNRPIMRFEVDREAADPSSLPGTLRTIEPLGASDRERNFTLRLDAIRGRWLINGKTFSMNRIDARPKLGTTETWAFENVSNQPHPMHVHLVMFQVLDRDGMPASGGEQGWKDTVRVDSGEIVRVAMRFSGHTGPYVFHCHNLPHSDHGMMGQMQVGNRR